MPASLLIIVSSAGALVFLVGIFYIEDTRTHRFFSSPRVWLDGKLQQLLLTWQASLLYVGGGAMRVWMHYMFHKLLGALMFLLHICNVQLARLQKRNKRVVRSVQAVRSETHLAAIEAHRQATALTPKEKQTLKDKSLLG